VIQKEAEYKKKKALYGSYADKLTSQESPVDKDGLLFVKCKNCGKSFSPTNGAVQARVFCLNHFGIGESHLYCSTKCKDSCDVFRAIKLRKSERSVDKVSRNCQQYIKKELQKIQCDSSGNTYCEKCGDIIGIELHHTNQVKDKVDTNNPAGMMLLCFRCHREAHTECK
jgi:Fe2+ or Zn2+ uptake regulation protein